MDSGQGSSRPAIAEGDSEAMQQAGLRLDIVVALIGGIISYFRLKPIVTQFLSQGFGNSSRHTVSDLYIAAFGAYAPETLLLIGVLSGAAMCFAVARSFTHLVRRLFPEAERATLSGSRAAGNRNSTTARILLSLATLAGSPRSPVCAGRRASARRHLL